MSPADYLAVRKIKDADGRYILEQDITAEGAERLFGIPVTVTSRIPTGKAVLADMSLVAVARDMAPTVVIDSSRYFDIDEVALRVVARFDLALLQPKARHDLVGLLDRPPQSWPAWVSSRFPRPVTPI